jgi:hypothetical protein
MGQVFVKKSRSRSRHKMRKAVSRVLTFAGVLLLAAGAIAVLYPSRATRSLSGSQFRYDKPAPVPDLNSAAAENEYPVSLMSHPSYSVIPGGVHSEKQLAEVLAHDPVVARHYANFDLQKLRFVRLGHGREAYVSYRLGNLIFWTDHKIPLFAGETLLTDGTHYARTRCGNRVSAVPKQPTTSLEPSDASLSAPILHLSPSSYKLPQLNQSVHLAPEPLDGGIPAGSSSSGGSQVFPLLFPPGGDGGGSGGAPVGNSPGDGPVPVSVPEPSAIVLLSCGLVVLSLRYLWSAWRD